MEEEIFNLPIDDVRQCLKKAGLNSSESSPGALYRRYWLFKALGPDALSFDIGLLETAVRHIDEWFTEDSANAFLRRESQGDLSNKAIRDLFKVYTTFFEFINELPGIFSGTTSKQKLVSCFEWLKKMICDFRPLPLRQSNEAIATLGRAEKTLGYTLENTFSLSHEDLIQIMKDGPETRGSLYRQEYSDNEEHLRSNMRLLIQRVKKLLRYQDRLVIDTKFHEVMQSEPTLEKLLEKIQKMSPLELVGVETKLELRDAKQATELGSDEFYGLFQYDMILQRIEKFIVGFAEQDNKTKIPITEVHASLPKLREVVDFRLSSGSSAYVDPHVVVCKTSRIADCAEIREIGLLCNGAYFHGVSLGEMLNDEQGDVQHTNPLSSLWQDRVPESAYHLEWHPSDEGREGGQSVDSVFAQSVNGQTLHTLYMPVGEATNCELFQIELQQGTLLSKHNNWTTCPCSQKDIASGARIFRRIVMQIKFTSAKTRLIADRMQTSTHKFRENGDTIAQLLLIFEQFEPQDFDTAFACTPFLLYDMSTQLRQTAFPEFEDCIRANWRQLIGETSKHDHILQQEAKNLVLDLIMAGKGGKYCSVLQKEHISYIEAILERCQIQLIQLMVEKSNFEVLMRRLHDLNKSNLTFVLLHVTGKLSGIDVSLLIDSAYGSSYRLLVKHYPQFISTLLMTRKISSVLVPPSLQLEKQYNTLPYNLSCPLLYNYVTFSWQTSQLRMQQPKGKLSAMNTNPINWKQHESAWRAIPYSENTFDNTFYMLIVTPDMDMIQSHYSMVEGTHILNPLFDEIEKSIDVCLSPLFIVPEKEGHTRPCLVVLNAHLLSEVRHKFVVSRCMSVKVKLVMVTDKYNPTDKTVCIPSSNCSTQMVEGRILYPLPDKHDLGTDNNVCVAFRAMRLLLGHLLTLSAISAIKEALAYMPPLKTHIAPSMAALLQEINVLEPMIALEVLQTCWSKIHEVLDHGKLHSPEKPSLLEFLCILCVQHVQASSLEQDIPFATFLKVQSVCQFVPQNVRIEMWIRQVLLNNVDELPDEWIVQNFTAPHSNVHSLHLLASFGSENTLASEPSYTYITKDTSISEQELLLQQCMQGQELEWTRLQEKFRHFPFGLDFFMLLLDAYWQPLKLLSLVAPLSLFHLLENATQSRFGPILDKLITQLSLNANHACNFLIASSTPSHVFSVLKWSLLSNGHAKVGGTTTLISFNQADIDALVESHIPLNLVNRDPTLITQLVPLILALDGPSDIIFQQVGLRQFFLLADKLFVDGLFAEKFAIGKCFLDFIFNNTIRIEYLKALELQKHKDASPFINHPLCVTLINWLEKGSPLEECALLVSRFSPAAVGFLISLSTTNAHTDTLWDCINLIEAATQKDFISNAFIDAQKCPHSQDQMVLSLQKATSLVTEIVCVDPFYKAIVASLYRNSLAPLEDLVNTRADLRFPVEVSNPVRALYIRHLSDEATYFPLLPTTSLERYILWHCQHITTIGNEVLCRDLCFTPMHGTFRFITFLCWLLHPFFQLPFLPNDSERDCFLQMAHHKSINLLESAEKNLSSVSNFALYLVAPQYLDIGSVNFFRDKLGMEPIEEKSFVICQLDSNQAPPYTLRVLVRPLPQALLREWTSEVCKLDLWKSKCDSTKFVFDVSSGVDEDLLALNLSALANLPKVLFKREAEIQKTPTPYFIAHTLFAWFVGMGIPPHELRGWLMRSIRAHFDSVPTKHAAPQSEEFGSCTSQLDLLDNFFTEVENAKITHTEATLYPLPSFIDVRLRTYSGTLMLFGKSMEEILFTYQFFTSYLSVLPQTTPPIDIRDVVEIDTLTSVDNQGAKPRDRYYLLPSESGNLLGDFIANQIQCMDFPANRSLLEDLCSSFCMKLNSVYDQRLQGQAAAAVVSAMLSSALFPISKLEPPLQAQLTLCLVSRISISRTPKSQSIIDLLLNLCNEKRVCFCAHTLAELKDMDTHGFAQLPSLKLYDTTVKSYRIPLPPPGYHPSKLNFKALIQFEIPTNNNPHLQPTTVKSQPTSANIPSKLSSAIKSEDPYTQQPLTIFEQQQTTLLDSNTTLQEWNINDGIYPIGKVKKHIFLREKCIIYCHDLLTLAPGSEYASLRVNAGMASFLVQHPKKSHLFCFVSASNWKQMKDPHSGFVQESKYNFQEGTIIASYATYGEAWEMISAASLPLTLLVLRGVMLKKAPNTNEWIPIILSRSPTSRQESMEGEITFWNLLDIHQLLCYQMDDSVVNLLFFLAQSVLDEYRPSAATTPNSPDKILSRLRKLETDNKKKQKVKTIAVTLCDIVRQILQQVSTSAINRASEVIRSAFKGKFRGLNLTKLEELLLCSLAHHSQLQQIMKSDCGLDIFFGQEAVIANTEILARVCSPCNEQIEDGGWDEPLFEDENVSASAPTGTSEKTKPGKTPFAGKLGFGWPKCAPSQVLSLVGPPPPLIYCFLDSVVHKPKYSAASGKVLAYLLHTQLFQFTGTNSKMIGWLIDVLRSPLSDTMKEWLLQTSCQWLGDALPLQLEEGQIPSSQIIAACLGKACPNSVLQRTFQGACPLPLPVEQFCQRRNNMYGVFFCSTSTLSAMQELGLWVQVVDLGVAFATGIATPDDLYMKIIGAFSAFVCFVYVKGLPTVQDLFLKWCCEYTQRCPWRFIYFENTDSTHNFSENRDRCNDSLLLHPSLEERLLNQYGNMDIYSVEYNYQTQSTKYDELLNVCFPEFDATRIASNCENGWEDTLKRNYHANGQFAVFVESPPGAGKTHLMEEIMKEEKGNRKCERVDCSNDELVERAMESVLSSKFPDDSKALLVADEFHMLSEEHKNQLIYWISSRLGWLKVFIIANRSNDFDDKLLGLLRAQNSGQGKACIEKMVCHLEIDKILRLFPHSDGRVMQFVEMWHIACRTLFGDESISLRHVKKLQEIMANKSSPPNLALATFFQGKMPALGPFMCKQFINTLLYLLKANANNDTANSAIQLLVNTSLLPYYYKKERNIASFPEFVRSLRGSMKVHPTIRLAAWVKRMHAEYNRPAPLLDSLLQLKVIDQIGFPLVLDVVSTPISLRHCDAFARKGDYGNLKWIHETLTHGYAINWGEVRTYWKSHYITNSQQYEELLSVCPNPAACLQAVDPKNLVVLIEAGSHRFARTVVEFYEIENQRTPEEDNPNSPYYAAAWFLLRQQESPFSLDPLDELQVDTTKVLLWASQFGFHALSVKDQQQERTEFLQESLIECTADLVEKMDEAKAGGKLAEVAAVEAKLATLWSHIFSPLLKVGTKHGGVAHCVTLLLAAHQYPPKPEWPPLVKHLSSVVYGKAEKVHVEQLLDTDFFHRLNERAEDDLDHPFSLPTGKLGARFVTGLMTINPPGSILSRQWQIHLLTTKDVVIPDLFASPKGLAQLELGLVTLRSPTELLIAPGKVRESLEGHRVFIKQSTNMASFTKDQQQHAISKAEHKQLKHFMRFLKTITEDERILNYYNTFVGANWRQFEKSEIEKFKMDEFNNPAGDKFDLGKNDAFGEYRILVGNFFHITSEFNVAQFKQYAQAAVQQKGFHVDLVSTEDDFIRKIDDYDQAWLISSSPTDAETRKFYGPQKWRNLADACERFYKSGRGLFLFADNDPYFAHSNVVLERLFGISLEGDTPAHRTLDAATTDPPAKGKFLANHLLGSGLQTLFEGSTICFPKAERATMEEKGLFTFAQSTDDHPAICFAENKAGGRIVVDMGFTKLWLNWNSAGNARYICNATVWLLAIEFRLNTNLPLRGPTVKNPTIAVNATLRDPSTVIPQARHDQKERFDTVLVLHNPKNLHTPIFQNAIKFSTGLAEQLIEKNVSNFGVVQYDNKAKEFIGPSWDASFVLPKLQKMKRSRKGTGANYYEALDVGNKMLLRFQGRQNCTRVLVFLTTEKNSLTNQLGTLSAAIRNSGVTIFAVGVGAAEEQSLVDITGNKDRVHMCDHKELDSLSKQITNKIKQLKMK